MVKKLLGILCDMLMKVTSFIFLADFVILDGEVDFDISIIFEKPFLTTGRTLVDTNMG